MARLSVCMGDSRAPVITFMLLPQVLGGLSEIGFPDLEIPADVRGVDRNGCTKPPSYQRLKQHRHPKRSTTGKRLPTRECRADPRPADTPSDVAYRYQPLQPKAPHRAAFRTLLP